MSAKTECLIFEMPIWHLKQSPPFGEVDFPVANTWPKITAREGYAMVRNGKEPKNPYFSLVAATFEKAITYVFAGSVIRNSEARSSTLLCSTNKFLPLKTYHYKLISLILQSGPDVARKTTTRWY